MSSENALNTLLSELENFSLVDTQPNIEDTSTAIQYDVYATHNFIDRNAYQTKNGDSVMTWFKNETEQIAKIRELLSHGKDFVNMLYSYRSVSTALPQVKTAEQTNKEDVYEKTFEVLEPEIIKLRNFMYFQQDAIKNFCSNIQMLAQPDKKASIISEEVFYHLAQMLDLFLILDALKNIKACLNNDFSFYKRAFQFVRKSMVSSDEQAQENHSLYLFLAFPNSITNNMKKELQKITGYDDVIALIVTQCTDLLERDSYIMPNEKYALLRVIPYGIFLMDGEQNGENVFKTKKLKLHRIYKVLKRYPVVPLYGDMQMELKSLVDKAAHFEERTWVQFEKEDKIVKDYELTNYLEDVRVVHDNYVARFTVMMNELKNELKESKVISTQTATAVFDLVLQGVRYLSEWTCRVLEQSAWKYAHPKSDGIPEDAVVYERVVRYNYSINERFVLVEFLSFIKGVGSLMRNFGSLIAPVIRKCIHDEVQYFIQVTLRDPIRHAN